MPNDEGRMSKEAETLNDESTFGFSHSFVIRASSLGIQAGATAAGLAWKRSFLQ